MYLTIQLPCLKITICQCVVCTLFKPEFSSVKAAGWSTFKEQIDESRNIVSLPKYLYPCPEVMHVIIGQNIKDANTLREYFKPLEDWLTVK